MMKNIQVIDGAENCTYDVFAATEEQFDLIFPGGTDVEFIEDVIQRLGEDRASAVMTPLWGRRCDKKTIQGIHGTLFFELLNKKKYYPTKIDAEMQKPDSA